MDRYYEYTVLNGFNSFVGDVSTYLRQEVACSGDRGKRAFEVVCVLNEGLASISDGLKKKVDFNEHIYPIIEELAEVLKNATRRNSTFYDKAIKLEQLIRRQGPVGLVRKASASQDETPTSSGLASSGSNVKTLVPKDPFASKVNPAKRLRKAEGFVP